MYSIAPDPFPFVIFSVDGSKVAEEICIGLEEKLDLPKDKILGSLNLIRFSDGELSPQLECSVRGKDVYLVGTIDTPEKILTMQFSISAAKLASADEIIVVIPYMGYSRQDRRDGIRGTIASQQIAQNLTNAGATRIVLIDLHAEQIQGFFSNLPVDHIRGYHIFLTTLRNEIVANNLNPTICSPDAGGVKRAEKFLSKIQDLNPTTSMLSKIRDAANSIKSMTLVGDVTGRDVIIIDDIVDTAGTLCEAANVLLEKGAKSVRVICTHAVLSGPAIQRLNDSNITKVIVSDTCLKPNVASQCDKIEVIPCSRVLTRAITAVIRNESLTKFTL